MSDHKTTGCCSKPTEPGPYCCAGPQAGAGAVPPGWLDGQIATPAGDLPRARTEWRGADVMGAIRVRCNIGRLRYTVVPGLYGVGNPDGESRVFVTANYKLSFDHVRRALAGVDAWILVLDTKGINVWCAAGKGTFGTSELIRRVAVTDLGDVVSHRTLIVPQLGATGVSAHQVKRECGWQVVYGPVRVADLPACLADDMRVAPAMRRVNFDLVDRLVVIPVELAIWGRYLLVLMLALLLFSGFRDVGYESSLLATDGLRAAGLVLAGFLSGAVLTPVLLPWIPGRSFAFKGLVTGLLTAAAALGASGGALTGPLEVVTWILIIPVLSSFMGLNFTGTSTFTSLSGVKREMRIAIPLQAVAMVAGLALWVVSRWRS